MLNQFSAAARADLNGASRCGDVNERSGLILDLRDNPGGFASSAIDVTSAVESGKIVTEDFGNDNTQVLTQMRCQYRRAYCGARRRSSASAELLAGRCGLRPSDIIGETTLGKGTATHAGQRWRCAPDDCRWLTPDGMIHQQGITPDIEVKWEDRALRRRSRPQLNAALDISARRLRLRRVAMITRSLPPPQHVLRNI